MARTVLLRGRTLKGKNRVREHGAVWTVEREGAFRGTPALLLTAGRDARWVLAQGDPDFDVVE